MNKVIPLALLLMGCKTDIAPTQLNDLVVYLYSSHAEEDPAVMSDALTKLSVWYDSEFDADHEGGYEVSGLTEETVDGLDEHDRSTEEILGLAVATESSYSTDALTWAMLEVSQADIYPDMFDSYEREFFGDPECFLAHECDRLESLEHNVCSFPLGLTTETNAYNQYLWVELDDGSYGMVQRNWLVEPPETNSSLLYVDEQMYMNLFFPKNKGSYRLQATWIVQTGVDIPISAAMSLTASNMEDNSEWLESFMDEVWVEGSEPVIPEKSTGCMVVSSTGTGALIIAFLLGLIRRKDLTIR